MEDLTKYDVKSFKIVKDFEVEIYFRDGKTQKIDFSTVKQKGVWKELEDLAYFKQVRINEVDNLEWPHGQDFKPKHLYNWEKFSKLYTEDNIKDPSKK